VVGVNRSAASRRAVLWAAREANLRHDVLIVTHVDLPTAYAPEIYDAATACHRLLVECATLASDAEPSIAVGTLLLTGGISNELVRLTQSADLLVMGIDPDHRQPGPGPLGSVESRVLCEADCPVVLVRDPTRSTAALAGLGVGSAVPRQRVGEPPPPEPVPVGGP
jgi:nucleotide-binding universal stress UspA family protein